MKVISEIEIQQVSGGNMNVFDALGPEFHNALMNMGVDHQQLMLHTLDATVAATVMAQGHGMDPMVFMNLAAIAFADGLELGAHVSHHMPPM